LFRAEGSVLIATTIADRGRERSEGKAAEKLINKKSFSYDNFLLAKKERKRAPAGISFFLQSILNYHCLIYMRFLCLASQFINVIRETTRSFIHGKPQKDWFLGAYGSNADCIMSGKNCRCRFHIKTIVISEKGAFEQDFH
jgi:hypothetical protein